MEKPIVNIRPDGIEPEPGAVVTQLEGYEPRSAVPRGR